MECFVWDSIGTFVADNYVRGQNALMRKSMNGIYNKNLSISWQKERNGLFCEIKGDLKTHNGDWTCQGFWVLLVYRFGRWRYAIRNPWIRKPFSLFYKICYKSIQILTGIELPCEVNVGKGFRIDHFGGIVISGYAKFGTNCVIRNGVTVGLRRVDEPTAPQIGNNVDIGAGAKLLGNITIGNNVDIGANAVVLRSVPSNSIAVGIPAKIIPKKQ